MSSTMIQRILLVAVALSAFASRARAQEATCWSIARFDNILRRIDTSGSTVGQQALNLPAQVIEGGNGLAWDSVSGSLHGLLQIQGQSGAELVTIHAGTGQCTSIGDTGDSFAAIAFDSDGLLYGLTGGGAITPQTLFTLSTVDATPTFIVSLSGGASGEALAFNFDNGLLYRASGGVSNGVFQSIDPNAGFAVTNIPMSGTNHGQSRALKYEGSGSFLLVGANDMLYQITTSGVVSFVGPMDHTSKGLASTPAAIPTMTQWGLIVLGLLLVLGGTIVFARRRSAHAFH